jgi:hypothetical protein
MKIVGVLAILVGVVFLILPAVTAVLPPLGFWFFAVILIVGGFFLYRGRLGKTAR